MFSNIYPKETITKQILILYVLGNRWKKNVPACLQNFVVPALRVSGEGGRGRGERERERDRERERKLQNGSFALANMKGKSRVRKVKMHNV